MSQAHPARVLAVGERRGAEMAAGEVAWLVAGQLLDHVLSPEIAAHKEAAS